jgi:hypothetical protein
MAYVSKETKAKIAPVVKAVLAKYKIKGTLSVKNHSCLTLKIRSGNLDFISTFNRVAAARQSDRAFRPATTHIDVNPYHFGDHFDGSALNFLNEVYTALKGPEYRNDDDIQSDYFSRSHYISMMIGEDDSPYNIS